MSNSGVMSKIRPKKELQLLIEGHRNGGSVRYDSVPFIDQQTGEQKGFKTAVYCPPIPKLMETAFVAEGFGWSKQQSQQAAAENALIKYKQNVNGVEDDKLMTMEDKIQQIQQQSCAIITNLMEMQKKCVALTNLMLEVQDELNTLHSKRKLIESQDQTLNKKTRIGEYNYSEIDLVNSQYKNDKQNQLI
eukprot:TRINITY_DN1804_c1_g1_i1.p1 TRINITY_DN1804_c1_g1~~TRINITY_DN1804_c1_g1_i1.p1  ORF type:complete len:190 (-),score=21.04 TRINITY_DN1804_c1_g1_i1:144-713(-)